MTEREKAIAIVEAIIERGLAKSMSEVATKLGRRRNYFYDIARNRASMSADDVFKLHEMYGVSVEYFYSEGHAMFDDFDTKEETIKKLKEEIARLSKRLVEVQDMLIDAQRRLIGK